MKRSSAQIHAESQKLIPGGVNSPVRAGKAVGQELPVIARGQGCNVFDVEGEKYIDYIASWGPLILGHAHPAVLEAVREAAGDGLSYGLPTERELELAEIVVSAVPSVEMVRLVNSGTEATMSAIRLARAFTKRDKIIVCAGGYHGHADVLLASAGSGMATLSIPSTPGVPEAVVHDTVIVPYNDPETVEEAYKKYPGEIAAQIIEPVAGNMGVVPPAEGYLQTLRELSEKHGALLILDEVMTGFRVAFGGAQQRYGITPDLTTLGKVIGGGMPVGAYGGRADIMREIAPSGGVYQAGTLSGNPLATAAGVATLSLLTGDSFYDDLETQAKLLEVGICKAAKKAGVPVQCNRVGSMMTFFFTDSPVTDFKTASNADREMFAAFWRLMRKAGVLLAPSPFEAAFLGNAHTTHDIRKTIRAADVALTQLASTPRDQLKKVAKA